MTDNDIDKLRKDYREMKAPPALATRISVHVNERSARRRNWMPAAAAASVAVVAVFLLFSTPQQQEGTTPTLVAENTTPKPTMSSLARVMKKRPSISVPSLSQVRTHSIPPPPSKPVPQTTKPAVETKTYFDIEPSISKEKDHVHS